MILRNDAAKEPILDQRQTALNKHRNIAGFLSLIFMGLGQFYNKQWLKGVSFFAIGCIVWYNLLFQFVDNVSGVLTLGQTPSGKVKVDGVTKFITGDHSIQLLINGLIFIFIFAILMLFYVINVRDAAADGRRRDKSIPLIGFIATLKKIHNDRFPLLILLLPAVFILFLNILPLLFNFLIAFTNFGVKKPPLELVDWTFSTFHMLFTDPKQYNGILTIAIWTIVFALFATSTCFLGGVLLAVMIEMKGIRFKAFWRMMIIIPFAIPQLVRMLVMKNMLNTQFGPINVILNKFGIANIPWLSDGTWAKISIIIVNMWGGFATSMILATGILATINKELYEAAEVDGAGSSHKFMNITMPILLVATTPYIVLAFASDLNNFGAVYLLTGGGPNNPKYDVGYTDIFITWMYKSATANPSLTAIISIFMFLLVGGFSLYNYRRSASYREEDINQ